MVAKKNKKPAKKVKSLRAKSLSAKQAGTVKGGDKAKGKANFNDIAFVHNIDKSSPVL